MKWDSSLCACFGEGHSCTTCCLSCWLPCIQFGKNYQALKDMKEKQGEPMSGTLASCLPNATGNTACCLYTLACCVGGGAGGAGVGIWGSMGGLSGFAALVPLLWQCEMRGLIRRELNIEGNECEDCCTSCCCQCCVLMQEGAELEIVAAEIAVMRPDTRNQMEYPPPDDDDEYNKYN